MKTPTLSLKKILEGKSYEDSEQKESQDGLGSLKDLITESVSTGALDNALLKFKGQVKGKLQGEVGEYVDILERIIDWMAGRTGAGDEQFAQFFQKEIEPSYEPASNNSTPADKAAEKPIKAKKNAKVQPPEEPAQTSAEPVAPASPKPPPLPNIKKEPTKDKTDKPANEPAKIEPPNPEKDKQQRKDAEKLATPSSVPSLSTLAKGTDNNPEDETEPDFNPQTTEPDTQSPKRDVGAMPSLAQLMQKKVAMGKKPHIAGQITTSKPTDNWKVGDKINVGFVKDLEVMYKNKHGFVLKRANGVKYYFIPHKGLYKIDGV